MQQYHGLPIEREQDAGNAIAQPDSHFPDISAQMIDQGHAQGPSELDSLDILSDGLPINGRQILQPLADRLRAGIGAEEANVMNDFLHRIVLILIHSRKHNLASDFACVGLLP